MLCSESKTKTKGQCIRDVNYALNNPQHGWRAQFDTRDFDHAVPPHRNISTDIKNLARDTTRDISRDVQYVVRGAESKLSTLSKDVRSAAPSIVHGFDQMEGDVYDSSFVQGIKGGISTISKDATRDASLISKDIKGDVSTIGTDIRYVTGLGLSDLYASDRASQLERRLMQSPALLDIVNGIAPIHNCVSGFIPHAVQMGKCVTDELDFVKAISTIGGAVVFLFILIIAGYLIIKYRRR